MGRSYIAELTGIGDGFAVGAWIETIVGMEKVTVVFSRVSQNNVYKTTPTGLTFVGGFVGSGSG